MGDVLLAASFVSYAGPFNMPMRQELVKEQWYPDIVNRNITMSEGITPLDMLTDDATKVRDSTRGHSGKEAAAALCSSGAV